MLSLLQICYNFEWLYGKCKALGITAVKKDLRVAMHFIQTDIDSVIQEQEEERRRKEKERRKLKGKVPNMEVATSQVRTKLL